jgi:cysteinyl-tRNA synthetase
MITINGQKMGKSLGNFINLKELFSGSNPALEQAYSPMTVRFFILQSQYRSTLDFSNSGLQGSAKGLIKLMNGLRAGADIKPATELSTINDKLSEEMNAVMAANYAALADDFNTAIVVANLFDMVKKINTFATNAAAVATVDPTLLTAFLANYRLFMVDILGLLPTQNLPGDQLLQTIIKLYAIAKEAKDYGQVDVLRADLKAASIAIKDTKAGVSWAWVE